jgi:hypothetical protein
MFLINLAWQTKEFLVRDRLQKLARKSCSPLFPIRFLTRALQDAIIVTVFSLTTIHLPKEN